MKLDEAEACYREALTTFRKQYNDSHRSIQFVAHSLIAVLTAKGDEAGIKQLNDEFAARQGAATAELVTHTFIFTPPSRHYQPTIGQKQLLSVRPR